MRTEQLTIEFGGHSFELPPLRPTAAELLVHVTEVHRIEVNRGEALAKQSRFNSMQPLRKVSFFVWREGLALTVRKVTAVLFKRKVERARSLVFVRGTLAEGKQHCVALGTQACAKQSHMIFPRGLVAIVDEAMDFGACARHLEALLAQNDALYKDVLNYSVHSERRLPLELSSFLAANDVKATCPIAVVVNEESKTTCAPSSPAPIRRALRPRAYDLFVVGCGAHPLIHAISQLRHARRHTVVDLNPCIAAVVQRRYGFLGADTNCERALSGLRDANYPLVVIATYHSTHFDIAKRALDVRSDTRIFIEKPPVTTVAQLQSLLDLMKQGRFIEIGYNRRHAPFVPLMKQQLEKEQGPVTMTCLVKKMSIPPSHWYYWPSQGTRVAGNLCHWFDLACYFINAQPREITLSSSAGDESDEVSASVRFDDDSLFVIVASDRGNDLRGVQEYIEIRRGGLSLALDDFVELRVQSRSGTTSTRARIRDKGHARMYRALEQTLLDKTLPTYPVNDLVRSTMLYLTVGDMRKAGVAHRRLDPACTAV